MQIFVNRKCNKEKRFLILLCVILAAVSEERTIRVTGTDQWWLGSRPTPSPKLEHHITNTDQWWPSLRPTHSPELEQPVSQAQISVGSVCNPHIPLN